MPIAITAFDLAQRFVGVRELPGSRDSHFVMAMLTLDAEWPEHDEVPWCSAFVNYVAWLLRLPRSKSLRARSWLRVGREVSLMRAESCFDVVILKRGGGNQPGPEVLEAPGHVGFYAGVQEKSSADQTRIDRRVLVLGGNQSNAVNVSAYPVERILGTRRLV